MTLRKIGRRFFLQSVGGLTVGLPFLEKFQSVAHAAITDAPKNAILLGSGNASCRSATMPGVLTGDRFDPIYGYIPAGHVMARAGAPLQPHLDNLVFVSHVTNNVAGVRNASGGRPFFFGHQGKHSAACTGALPVEGYVPGGANRIEDIAWEAEIDEGSANAESADARIGRHLQNGHPRQVIHFGTDWNGRSTDSGSKFFFESASTRHARSRLHL